MSPWVAVPASLVLAYLSGGIPFGVMVARRYGVDITTQGSGNTGATNVFRTLGWRAGLATALLDIAKGAAPALAALLLTHGWDLVFRDLLVVATSVAAMAGHMYSPYYRLRGGKGIATAAGGVVVLMPLAFLLLLPTFALLVAVTRVVSLASLTVALAFPVTIWALYPDRPVLLAFAGAACPLVFWRHRANIGRLFRGQEPRIQWRPRIQTPEREDGR